MVMASKKTFSYQTRLFFIVNVFFWLLVFVFVAIQYIREKEYKASLIDMRLQVYNDILIREYEEKGEISLDEMKMVIREDSVRITLLDRKGNVLFDSHQDFKFGNHRNRPEIMKALASGSGYTIRRLSESDNHEYFYSATAGKDVIVRTALPYDLTLVNVLKGDFAYVWIILGITAVINVILYFAVRRISSGVRSLRDFANWIENSGDSNVLDYDTSRFPDDELGEVSAAIINIYKELKKAIAEKEESMHAALFEEREKNRIKHQLTSNINHELKTPVQSIQGCFETVLNSKLDKKTERKLLETGYCQALRLSNLLQDIALITRISDAKGSFEKQEVNIHNVVMDILQETEQFSSAQKMRVNVDIPEDTVIKGSKQLVDAIFRNLVNNAMQYSGGRDVFISMTKETEDSYWFDVYDNGSGVEEQHLPRIFERFYRIDSGRSRKSGGTGLGLSIVRNAVLFHGGEIVAQNRKYAGLEFIFSLHK